MRYPLIRLLALMNFPMAAISAVAAEAPQAVSPAASLSLQDAVAEGCRNNLDLLALHHSIPMARADELTAGLWGNPSLQLGATWDPLGRAETPYRDETPGQTNLGISMPLDLSGKIHAARKSARAATKVAELEFMDAVRRKVLEIQNSYIDGMTLQNQVTLAFEKAEDYNELVHIIENRIGRKTVRPLLLTRAQLARDQARLDLRRTRAELASAKTLLGLLLGRLPGKEAVVLATELRDFKLTAVPEAQSSVARALETRPDLLALKATAVKASLDHGLARHQAWDDFNLALTLGRSSPVAADPEDPASVDVASVYSLDGALVMPLPWFNRNQGNIAKARLGLEQARTQVAALELGIRQEIGDELEQLRMNQDLIVEYESTQIKNARQVRDSQQTQFGTGYIALLDYFDAMEAYNGVLSSYYVAVGNYRKNLASLNASVGCEVMP